MCADIGGAGGIGRGSSVTYNPITPISCDCAKKLIKDCILSNLPYIGCALDIPKCLLNKIPAVAAANQVAGCVSALDDLANSCPVGGSLYVIISFIVALNQTVI